MPIVVLGAVVSLGVVAVTASRFGRRRTKADEVPSAPEPAETSDEPNAPDRDTPPARRPARFLPAPPRNPDAPRWDTPPPADLSAPRDPP